MSPQPGQFPSDSLAVFGFAALLLLLAAVLALLLLRRAPASRIAPLEAELATARAGAARAGALELECQVERDARHAAQRQLAERDAQLDAARTETARLHETAAADAARLETLRREATAAAAARATLAETLDQERRHAAEKLALLQDARAAMTKEFRALSDEALVRHGETFGRQNREQVDAILKPLQERIVEFAAGLATAQGETTKERATLAEQIRALTETSSRMTTETLNLTRALKGKSQTQGAWGEMILSSILERCGLREGEEYVTQSSATTEEGRRLRPDVIVRLPGQQRLVVDAKVSLLDYETSINAETELDRAAALRRHVASIRNHVRGLGSKEYQAHVEGTVDYVILFMPIEGALASALTADPELTRFAIDANVAIATPSTLMIALRTVASVWQVERRQRNAEDIAARAGKLYDKFVSFADDMTKLGVRLDQAGSTWRDAMGKLSQGSGNLVGQVDKLKQLGARTQRTIPSALLGGEDEASAPPTPPLLART